jgi:hypothetical protein
MKTVIALALLLIFASALKTDFLHDQPRPTTTTTTTGTTGTNTVATGKGPGFLSAPGDPYGRDPAIKRTCFQAPCFEPVEYCAQGWRAVLFVVPTSNYVYKNGGAVQTARFVGYEC